MAVLLPYKAVAPPPHFPPQVIPPHHPPNHYYEPRPYRHGYGGPPRPHMGPPPPPFLGEPPLFQQPHPPQELALPPAPPPQVNIYYNYGVFQLERTGDSAPCGRISISSIVSGCGMWVWFLWYFRPRNGPPVSTPSSPPPSPSSPPLPPAKRRFTEDLPVSFVINTCISL